MKKYKSNPKKLCAMQENSVLFPLTFQFQKSCTYPSISPEWCKCAFTFMIPYAFLVQFSVVTVSYSILLLGNSIKQLYTKAYSCWKNLGIF